MQTVYHVLCPRKCRTTIKISSTQPLNAQLIQESLDHESVLSHTKAYILDIKETASEDKSIYVIVFLRVQLALIHKLKTLDINRVVFHVGKSEDMKSYPIMDGVPNDLATEDYSGHPRVCSSGEIII